LFPVTDNYVYDALDINPAYAGCHDGLSSTLMYRDQWVGINGAPKNLMMSVHTTVDNDHIGLGLLIDESSFGVSQETNILGNYSYRMDLFNGKLALGLGFGITEYQISWNNLSATDVIDNELLNNPSSAILPAFSIGSYFYSEKYFIGISLPLFLTNEVNQKSGTYQISNQFSNYNYFINSGYEITLSSMFKLLPSLLIKYHPNTIPQIDYNIFIDYQNLIWLGLAYRNSNSTVARLMVQFNYQLKLVYSYDYDLGTLGSYENGSHEIGIVYTFNYLRKVKAPR
jgi:type IX secretion system PorP/SprF family membrane protein